MLEGSREDGSLGERLLQVPERGVGLVIPYELIRFLEEPVQGERLLTEPRDEATQRGNAACKPLGVLEVLRILQHLDGLDFVRIGFNPSLGDNEAE